MTLSAPDHPFYLDHRGVNSPGPDKHPNYGALAASDRGITQVKCTVRGRQFPAWLVSRYADVQMVMRDQANFSRAAAADADPVNVSGTILGMDGPEHARVRGVVRDAFTKEAVSGLRETVERQAAGLLAEMTRAGAPADLVAAFAFPFTLHTICDLLGLPRQDRTRFRQWGDAFLGTADAEQAAQAVREMCAYLSLQIDERRSRPGDDLLTRIAAADAGLSAADRAMLALALVVGGWETTTSAIAYYTYLLHTRPYGHRDTAWDYLQEYPDKADGAVTELERLHSIAAGDHLPRRAMADVTLPSGARISKGDILIPSQDAANRDPRVFPDPGRMDFDRNSSHPHLSYGYGAHYCVGARLGALEVRTAIRTLLQELPQLRLAVPPAEVKWKSGRGITCPQTLPVEW